jgi:capsular exopolysaccharide synthesis family protein
LKGVASRPTAAGGTAAHLIMLTQPRSPAAEAYRTLRTNLQFAGQDRAVRTVLITSALPGEGKSTVLGNVAVAAAEAGLRVIAVDTDLRRPSLHELFGLPQADGFSSVIARGSLDDVPLQESGIPGLRILTSGALPSNPAQVVASPRAEALIRLLGQQADLVLLDSPPVGPVADAVVLASRCDGVVFVVRLGRTGREAVRRARAQLEQAGARLLGPVCTFAELDRAARSYYSAR